MSELMELKTDLTYFFSSFGCEICEGVHDQRTKKDEWGWYCAGITQYFWDSSGPNTKCRYSMLIHVLKLVGCWTIGAFPLQN